MKYIEERGLFTIISALVAKCVETQLEDPERTMRLLLLKEGQTVTEAKLKADIEKLMAVNKGQEKEIQELKVRLASLERELKKYTKTSHQ